MTISPQLHELNTMRSHLHSHCLHSLPYIWHCIALHRVALSRPAPPTLAHLVVERFTIKPPAVCSCGHLDLSRCL